MLPVGDELWMYYSGRDQHHDKVTGADYRLAISCVRVRQEWVKSLTCFFSCWFISSRSLILSSSLA